MGCSASSPAPAAADAPVAKTEEPAAAPAPAPAAEEPKPAASGAKEDNAALASDLVDNVVDEALTESEAAEVVDGAIEEAKANVDKKEVPSAREALIAALEKVGQEFSTKFKTQKGSAEGNVDSDDIVAELMANGVKECEAQEVFDVIDDNDDGTINLSEWNAGVAKYGARVIAIDAEVEKVMDDMYGPDDPEDYKTDEYTEEKETATLESVALKLKALSAFKAAAKKQPTKEKTMSIRTLALISTLAPKKAEKKPDLLKIAGLVAKAAVKLRKSEMDKLVEEYTEEEKKIQDLITDPARKDELKKLWKDCDYSGNGRVSFTEVDRFMKKTYPLFVQPRATKTAYKMACKNGDGDDWVERKEFPSFLEYAGMCNKVMFVFDEIDTGDDGRVNKEEFGDFAKKVGADLTPEQAEEEFGKIDTDGSGKILFNDFLKWCKKDNALLDIDED